MELSDIFHDGIAESKFLLCLYEKIISGEFSTFESLKNAVGRMTVTNSLRKCMFKSFELQRKLYWGFFRDLTPKKYPELWKALVIPDREFRFAGDLKRQMSIPELYLGLLDIHGYTKYCNDKKRNMSMVDLLDRMIYEDVNAVCAENGVISKRAQGDEILIIGASPDAVLKSVLQIMEYFNTQGRTLKNTVLSRKLPGTVLPKFQISAGIAGGQKFTPLVITRDGDISGDIVNTAARLQARANKVSPDKNRIMLTRHVYQKYISLNSKKDDVFSGIDFFNTGPIEFKGTCLNVYDIVFLPQEADRLKLRDSMEDLYIGLEKRQWKTRVMNNALEAAEKAVTVCLEAGCSETTAGKKTETQFNGILDLLKKTHTLLNGMYYEAAISSFAAAVDLMNDTGKLDRIVLDYLVMIKQSYLSINEKYSCELEKEVSIRLNDLCSPREKENYLLLRKHGTMYEKIRASTRHKLQNRRIIWHRVTDEISDELNTVLQSFK